MVVSKKLDRYSSNIMDFTSYLYTLMSIDKLEWFLCISAGRVCVRVFVSYTHIQKMFKPFLVFDAISPWPWLKAAFTQHTSKSGHAHASSHTERKDESKKAFFCINVLSWLCAQIKKRAAETNIGFWMSYKTGLNKSI